MSAVISTPRSTSFADITESTDNPSSHSRPYEATQNQDIEAETTAMRDVIISFLRRCDIPYKTVAYDNDFDAQCRAELRLRGCPMDGAVSVGPSIRTGVMLARTAYGHLSKTSEQIFIALYTIFLLYLEDTFHHHVTAVEEFNERFICGQTQADPVLECFAVQLREIPARFGSISANIIITSTLNFATAVLLEDASQRMPLSTTADRYPTFARTMAGAAEAYGLFVFPPELPLPSYIQALPHLMIYLNNGNDILSFYKEQLVGETVNYVSIFAGVHGTSKIKALSLIANETAEAHEKVLQILAPHAEAYQAYLKFSHAYVDFHASAKRYRLNELDL